MMRITRFGLWLAVFTLVATAMPIAAQQGGRGGGFGGGFGGRGGGISPELILALLAFDDKFGVTDEQLIKLRGALKDTYKQRQEMLEDMRSGEADFQEVRETMMALNGELMEKTASVLDEEQVEALKKHMKEMQERRGNFRGGGRPGGGRRGGGGGGGGDGDGGGFGGDDVE